MMITIGQSVIVAECEGNRFCNLALYEVSSSSRSPGIAKLESAHGDRIIASITWLVDGCTVIVVMRFLVRNACCR